LLYPNNIKKSYKKEISYKNRGMDLEYLIEEANTFYQDNDIAYIYKKPTPIKVVETAYSSKGIRIKDAFYEAPSTLDFNGLYKGYYVEFDAKETKSKTSFPIANIHPHQIKHIKNIYRYKGIVFLIIMINDEYYLLPGKSFIDFLSNKRKSIPYQYIKDNGYNLIPTLRGLDYIKYVDKLIEGESYEESKD